MNLLDAVAELNKLTKQQEALNVIKDALQQVGSFDQAVKEAKDATAKAQAETKAEADRLAGVVESGKKAVAQAKADVTAARAQATQLIADAKAKGEAMLAAQSVKTLAAVAEADAAEARRLEIVADLKTQSAELLAVNAKLADAKAKIAKLLE